MKTTVSSMITRIKRQADYNVTDSDLDDLVVDKINNSLKVVKNWLMDRQLYRDCSKSASFKTIENQEFVDITQARIVGNVATFTGIANDKLKVTIDGTAYDDIDVSASTDIADVVTAINTAAGSTVASESDDSYLIITSPTTGSSSSVTIADGGTTGQTVVGDLFSTAAERTQDAIIDVDEIIAGTERTNDTYIPGITFDEFKQLYPNPTIDKNTTPDYYARFVERFYFGPTPSENILIYFDYIFDITEIASGGTLPFKNKYDPLIEALCVMDIAAWQDPDNRARMTTVEGRVKFWKKELIDGSSNIGISQATASRKPEIPFFAPKKVVN